MRSLLIGLLLTASTELTAQNPGDQITVKFGDWTSPTATSGPALGGLSISYNFPTFVHQQSLGAYPAAPFDNALADGQKLVITSFQLFNTVFIGGGFYTNAYNVFMSAGNGPQAFFGVFSPGGSVCTATKCAGYTIGLGSFLYDPLQGALGIQLVERADIFNGVTPNWYADDYPSGGRGIVTQFTGTVVTPEPSTLLLLGTGLIVVVGVARRRHA